MTFNEYIVAASYGVLSSTIVCFVLIRPPVNARNLTYGCIVKILFISIFFGWLLFVGVLLLIAGEYLERGFTKLGKWWNTNIFE